MDVFYPVLEADTVVIPSCVVSVSLAPAPSRWLAVSPAHESQRTLTVASPKFAGSTLCPAGEQLLVGPCWMDEQIRSYLAGTVTNGWLGSGAA